MRRCQIVTGHTVNDLLGDVRHYTCGSWDATAVLGWRWVATRGRARNEPWDGSMPCSWRGNINTSTETSRRARRCRCVVPWCSFCCRVSEGCGGHTWPRPSWRACAMRSANPLAAGVVSRAMGVKVYSTVENAVPGPNSTARGMLAASAVESNIQTDIRRSSQVNYHSLRPG